MKTPKRNGRIKLTAAALTLAGLLLLAGCGNFYSADIQGYVQDGESGEGINGVTIYLFDKEPELPDDESFFTKTSTANFNGEAGYYSSKVIWQSLVGRFGPEGDSGEIYMGVTHPDYADIILTQRGIFSDTSNILEDIELDRTTFSSPLVSGRVVNSSGEGVNGVRLVLDLNSTPDEAEDYVAVSATVDGTIGVFEFNNVTWTDETAAEEGTSSTESATVSVDDNEWENSGQPVEVSLDSDQEYEISSSITVSRIPQSEFQVELQGSIENRDPANGGADYPYPGVLVEITYDELSFGGTTRTLQTYTDAAGQYSFIVQWSESSDQSESSIFIRTLSMDLGGDGDFDGSAPDDPAGIDRQFDWTGASGREVTSTDPVHDLPVYDPYP
ncbi:hypothetical protein [Salinispira pacifica]|uniref:Lipoprotein n=1 Tax=Salinispira pacifica TaxID=1307761 RepID=V5WCG1_9SPIO|nr:hypothetical protein [Salinispira pacifica]AHC13473.1 hypothetical protein L21SP2_0027 [Salinispira pacifica]